MTASHDLPPVIRRPALRRAVRAVARALRTVYHEQTRMWEVWCLTSRVPVDREGPLAWTPGLDGPGSPAASCRSPMTPPRVAGRDRHRDRAPPAVVRRRADWRPGSSPAAMPDPAHQPRRADRQQPAVTTGPDRPEVHDRQLTDGG